MKRLSRLEWPIVVGIVIAVLLAIIGWVALCTWILMTAWNFVMPPVFGWSVLTFWQAFALSIVVNLLATGFRTVVHTRDR